MNRLLAFITILLVASIVGTAIGEASPEVWKQEGWSKTNFEQKSVDFKEILSGGPPKDGIPSIDNPKFIQAKDEKELGDLEPVIGLEINGEAKAYPLRILIWHEIVNDVVGGKPVAVTYCPLCNSAIVFEREFNGKVHDFGTTGKLRNSDLVMYDRQTESWWQQFIGTGIVGEYTNHELNSIPARLESFQKFKLRHSKGKILVPRSKKRRQYGLNPYVGYDSRTAPYPLFQGELPTDINPMARVIVVKSKGKPYGVAMNLVRKSGSVTIEDIKISWEKGQNSALDNELIKNSKDVGNIIAQREIDGNAVDVVYDVTFAFVFNSFYPNQTIKKD